MCWDQTFYCSSILCFTDSCQLSLFPGMKWTGTNQNSTIRCGLQKMTGNENALNFASTAHIQRAWGSLATAIATSGVVEELVAFGKPSLVPRHGQVRKSAWFTQWQAVVEVGIICSLTFHTSKCQKSSVFAYSSVREIHPSVDYDLWHR